MWLFSLGAVAEYKLNFPDPVTRVGHDIYGRLPLGLMQPKK